ncbi:PucR family transcriptional regulator [Staphylococcus delphini]|uniref:PucR family transcriptional regulator n=1 Tax=Staphylococcus delphini TaxID=53344 RepID=UPI0023B20F0F|nr:PucR family transcriptional regulator [Staphylococcus delphini]MDE9798582.1 PucR family transcriptional regulator ligand-binding domain-containing protein [Staphylococcus delphini]MDE9805827.1 PucR family transcriptional regulator ligand-binding domain-containing protein [Staphylococcus delphini]
MATLEDILQVEQFSGLSVLNDKADLNHIVESVDITETPDVMNYTTANALLLTTGMIFQNNQRALIDFIRELHTVPIAGLAIKLSRFLQKLDQEVIDFANELNFPLIEIPSHWKLGPLTHHISSFILDEETEKLYYALDIQQKMNRMLINEYPVSTMIHQMAKILKVPVMLINPFHLVESKGGHFENDQKATQQALKFFHNTYLEQKLQNEHDFQRDYVVLEVPAFKYFPYYLLISKAYTLSYPFSHLALEQAINTLSFAIYKNSKIRATEQHESSQFFTSLMYSKDPAPIDMRMNPEFFKRYNLKHSNYYQVIICGVDKEEGIENSVYLSERHQLTFDWLYSMMTDLDNDISVFGLNDQNKYAILLQKRHTYYLDYCRFLQKEYQKHFNSTISFGIGHEVTDFKQIPMSFVEANDIYDTYVEKEEKEFLNTYKSKNVEELLQLVPTDKLRPFVTYTLGPLAYPDNPKDQELKKTLKTFVEHQCDITQTANILFIHRNTVKYRIKKCEELLNMDITHPKNSLDIRIAIYTSEHIAM